MRPARNSRRPDSSAAADPTAAETAALGFLARREYSVLELRNRLARQGYSEEAVGTAIAELLAAGTLSDQRFAATYASLHAGRRQGPVRIAADLRRVGVAVELIQSALTDVTDWAATARALRIRRFGAKSPATWSERARQARFLQYRGFSSEQIRSALGGDIDPDTTA